MGKLRAVFHVDEPAKWPLTLSSVRNFLNHVGRDGATVEVVANAAGVAIFPVPAAELAEQLAALAHDGVRFVLCRNALRSQGIDEADLPPFVTVVPAGITEVVRRQQEGYSYIKP